MNMKIRYDLIRKSLDLKVDDLVFLKLHKGYTQPDLINRKFSKQRLGPVKILEKIGKLAYRLKIPSSWKIHPVVSAIHLEPAPIGQDPYQREERQSGPIEDATGQKDIYEVEKVLVKRSIK